MATSEKGKANLFEELLKTIATSARESGFLEAVPAKIISERFATLRSLGLSSPSAQRVASSRLLLPQPLGPTIAVMRESVPNSISVESAKVLKPRNCSARKNIYIIITYTKITLQ